MERKATYEELEHRVKKLENEALEGKQVEEERDRILNLSSDLISIADMDGYWNYVNPAWEKILGYTIEEMLSRPFLDFIHPEDHKKSKDEVASLVSGNETIGFENRYICKDGSIRTISWRATYLPETRMLYCIGRDITAQKRAEEEQKRLQKQLSNAMEIALLGHWEYDVANDLFTFNDHFYKMLRTTTKQVGGYTMSSAEYANRFVHPDDMTVVGEEIQKAIGATETNFRRQFQHRMIYADGTVGHISVQFFIVKDSQGRTIRTYGVNQDITESKRTMEALQESEERYRKILENVLVGVYQVTLDGKFLFANQKMTEMFGFSSYEELEAIGSLAKLHAKPEERPEIVNEIISKGFINKEIEFRRKDGQSIWVKLHTRKATNKEGAIILEGLMEDVTEIRKMAAQLQQSQKMEAVGTLAGGIAHDYNNLLAVIMGNLSMVQEENEPHSVTGEFLHEIEQASLKARDLTHQFLTLSQGGYPRKELGSMESLLKEILGQVQAHEVSTTSSIQDDLWPVEYDSKQMHFAISNVIINAVEAMPQGGIITLQAENQVIENKDREFALFLDQGKYVRLSIKDEGKGIPKEHLNRIFDPYFSTKERGVQKGMGLGLTTAYAVVQKHGGNIMVNSTTGVGTTVTIYLPASERPESKAPGTQGNDVGAQSPIANQQSTIPRILVMDDEESLRILAQRMLERLGYKVETVKDGAEAIETYKKHIDSGEPFDAVILDLTIKGGMGGVQAIKELIKIDLGVKAIVCSGYFNDPVLANFEEHGFRGAMAKPYQKADLESVLNQVLG